MSDWQNNTEIVFGRCADGRENLALFRPNWFIEPYDKAFEILKGGGTKTQIVRVLSLSAYQAAIQAAQSLNGHGEDIDWQATLRRSAAEYALSEEFEKNAKKLRKGQEINSSHLMELMKDIIDPERIGMVNANLIDYSSFQELIPSGWSALDFNLGGIPHAAPLVVGGETGRGKSFFGMQLLNQFLKLYTDKTAAVQTAEMPSEQWLRRADKVYGMGQMIADGRIYISDRKSTIDDISVNAAATPNLGIVLVDYIDHIVKDNSEDAYARAYIGANDICRTLHVPLCMIAQPNRNQYLDPIPRMHHLRYSGMAENVAGQLLMLFSPKTSYGTQDDYEEAERKSGFEFIEDSMYIVAWKNRAGWVGMDEDHPSIDGKSRIGPGAIVLPKSKNLWNDTTKGKWLVYGDVPQSLSKVSKRRKARE